MRLRSVLTIPCLCVAFLALNAARADASIITFETRFSTAGPLASGAAYQTTIEALTASAATSGYCSTTVAAWDNLSNSLTCGGSSSNVAYDVSASFGVSSAQAGTWSFRMGPDFGNGGALYLDGTLLEFQSTDMWWNGSYGNPLQYLAGSITLTAGNHVLQAYGLEPCCDGPQQAQFLAPGSTVWTTFSSRDGLNAVTAPEPASLALLGTGLAMAGVRRRKKRR